MKILLFGLIICFIFVPAFLYSQQTDYNDTINANKIIEKLSQGKDVFYENILIEGDLDFTRVKAYRLNDRMKLEDEKWLTSYTLYIDNSITFINCKFNGRIIAFKEEQKDNYNVTEYRISFQNKLTFFNSTFEDTVNLYEATFMNNVNFHKSTYKKKMISTRARYKGATEFGGTYKEEADFSQVLFEKTSSFINSTFEKEVLFSDILFVSLAIFTNSVFHSKVDFTWTRFSDDVYFYDVIFKKLVDFSNASFSLGNPIFDSTKFEGGILLEDVSYTSTF